MCQPKRLDEIALYTALRDAARTSPSNPGYLTIQHVHDAIESLGIHRKRAWYLLAKWKRVGWVSESPNMYFVCAFNEEAPERITIKGS